MFDAEIPGREPDAILYAPSHESGLWSLPWIAAADISEVKADDEGDSSANVRAGVRDRPPEFLVRLWFQPSDALPKPQDLEPLGPVPDRAFDLEVYNAGHAPPEGFWRVHPAIEAYEVEYDPDDGGNWWTRLWLKAA